MKKISVIALIICILFVFAGCGAGNKGPSEKEMKNSLIEQGANIYYLNYLNQELEYYKFELTKRKIDEAYDEAYISAVLENEDYIVTVEYILYHSYYDVGGWILDYFEPSLISIEPKGVNTNEVIVTDELSRFFNRFEIIDNVVGTTAEGYPFDAYTFEGYYDYTYASEKFTGEYAEIFIYNTWEPNYYIVNEGIDWSGLIGTWRFEHFGEYLEVTITDIYETENDVLNIEYYYSASKWAGDEPMENYFFSSTGYYDIDYKTVENRESTGTLVIIYREANMGNMSCEAVQGAYGKGFKLKTDGYEYSDSFEVCIDLEKGLYIESFLIGYKDPNFNGNWLDVKEKVYFEKIN